MLDCRRRWHLHPLWWYQTKRSFSSCTVMRAGSAWDQLIKRTMMVTNILLLFTPELSYSNGTFWPKYWYWRYTSTCTPNSIIQPFSSSCRNIIGEQYLLLRWTYHRPRHYSGSCATSPFCIGVCDKWELESDGVDDW